MARFVSSLAFSLSSLHVRLLSIRRMLNESELEVALRRSRLALMLLACGLWMSLPDWIRVQVVGLYIPNFWYQRISKSRGSIWALHRQSHYTGADRWSTSD
jgi:hypothetical protein